MPSPLPSSFASAAAGNTQDSTGTRRGDGIGTGEWSRSRVNGATQTFRRPSGATSSAQSQSRESSHLPSSTSSQTAPYIPPHLNSNFQSNALRNGSVNESRYSKEQLLGLYKSQREFDNLGKNVTDYFMAEWNPRDASGAWKKDDQHKENTGPEICWDHAGQIQPLSLKEMDDDEKELFSTSINSPLKPPPQSASKDSNNPADRPGRKSSVSQSNLNNYNASPTANRPGTRRRETADSSGNPMSPSGNSRFFRDEPNTSTPPPALLRRKTDFRDSNSDAKLGDLDDTATRDNAADTGSPFGSLKRSATNPVAGAGSSAWSSTSQSSSYTPMGAFGSFSLGPSAEKKAALGGSHRGESRFKGLLPKENSEEATSNAKEKPPLTNLERLPETENDEANQQWEGEKTKTRGVRSETNPFGEEQRSGSAALGGAQDTGAPGQGLDQLGFSAFGMSSNNVPGIRELMQSQEQSQGQTPQQPSGNEPMSPTNTNPYQSPHGERAPADTSEREDPDMSHAHLPSLDALRDDSGMGPFGPIRRGGSGLDLSAGDRSQTSSAGPGRGFSNLGGLGGLGNSGGWPTSAASGTPTRERSGFPSGFGDPIFGSMGDIQSPSLSTLGGGGFFGSQAGASGTGSIGRASKMGSLFPSAMQEQMRGEQAKQEHLANEGARQQPENDGRNVIGGGFDPSFPKQNVDPNAFGGGNLFSGLSGLDVGGRMMRGEESYFSADKLNQPGNGGSGQMPMSSVVGQPPASAIGTSLEGANHPGHNLSQSGSPSNNPLPATQQRQMVMPDRMRWIYRDPQGNTQGPWSGLEMHDWFKAGFFTAELQVKKLEDGEYEPLAQLVRRIGNSREPFLVPQIGVPHGPVPNQSSNWTGGAPGAGTGVSTPQSGAAQPPFPSSFPSFGTTLTAEQQNALERRKQEEQYLMARQKEHLAQQQVLMKQMQMQGGPPSVHPHQLQHHSSAHSLHSQPSYGSITSPGGGGYQPSPGQGPIQAPQSGPGFFDGPLRQNTMPNLGSQMLPSDATNREEALPGLLERLNVNRGEGAFGTGPSFGARQQENSAHSQQVAAMLQDRARLQQEQEQYDLQNQSDSTYEQQAREERLRQFHSLRNDEEFGMRGQEGMPPQPNEEESKYAQENEDISASMNQNQQADDNDQVLSLSQQVQKAASAQRQLQQQQQQTGASQSESPWGKVDNQPFPPPPSASPLPAPAAQRNRQNVADALAAESRSHNQTPIEAPTTSMAPWAKESNEGPKGPSLKEIQEAEAKKAAQQEEIAAAARRALAEQERLNQPPAPAPGLPSSANWASSGSPATPNSSNVSVWTKPLPNKNTTPSNASGKKTLAQIQKEEEARKQRQSAANATQTTSTPSPTVSNTGAKRYADLASKVTPATTAAGGAWTTVGAGGKPKAPPAAPAGPRSASGTMAPATIAQKPRTVPTTRPSAMGSAPSSNQNNANEEFTKWTKTSLAKGLNTGINVDDFVQQLLLLPPETEIISDSVYANSQTLDGRRFAEEFVRRRKLADKGVVDPAVLGAGGNGFGSTSDSKASSGGWSEVAKKGPVSTAKDDSNTAFKVVAAKKKGKR